MLLNFLQKYCLYNKYNNVITKCFNLESLNLGFGLSSKTALKVSDRYLKLHLKNLILIIALILTQ